MSTKEFHVVDMFCGGGEGKVQDCSPQQKRAGLK